MMFMYKILDIFIFVPCVYSAGFIRLNSIFALNLNLGGAIL